MTEVKVPPLGESIQTATVSKIPSIQLGGSITADDLLFELETDKVTLEVHAPVSGTLTSVKIKLGDSVENGQVIAEIDENNQTQSIKEVHSASSMPLIAEDAALSSKNKEGGESSQAGPIKTDNIPREKASPAARKLLNDENIKTDLLNATGKGGRLTKADILEAREKANTPPIESISAENNSNVNTAPAFLPTENYLGSTVAQNTSTNTTVVKMTKIRQKIAENLKKSQSVTATLTTFNEVDMSEVISLRDKYKEAFEKKHSIKLGFMSFFVKATIAALKEIPELNAEIIDQNIIYKHFYNIGIAVGTEQGLVVPVLKNAENFSFAEIELAITNLGKKARDNKIKVEDLMGGTFTITNGGIYGSLLSTPIINPPQTGILGLHKLGPRPVVIDGKIEIRPMMYIALSYDHRLVDGKGAVTFLVRIKERIENPSKLLLEI